MPRSKNPKEPASIQTQRHGSKRARGFFDFTDTILVQPHGSLLGQRTPDSCVPACCRMILCDYFPELENNPDFSEHHLRNLFQTNKKGSSIKNVPVLLYQLGLPLNYEYREGMTLAELRATLLAGVALVTVRKLPDVGAHAVLVEEITNDWITVRDPLPEQIGSAYRIQTETFLQAWSDENDVTHAVVVSKSL